MYGNRRMPFSVKKLYRGVNLDFLKFMQQHKNAFMILNIK